MGCMGLADKGCASGGNRISLQKGGIIESPMYKEARGRKLDEDKKLMNRITSGIRDKMEWAFGTLKLDNGFQRIRYMGLTEVKLEFLIDSMACNIKRQSNAGVMRPKGERCLQQAEMA